jgi:phosphoglycerate dehydrogenase-like enzyme
LLVEDAYNPGRVARQLMVLLCNQGASVRLADLVNHEWMGAADVVSIHLPAKSCYRGIVDRRMLAKMRRGVTLVNTSRDTVVNAYPLGGDVYEALATGAIRRYATDFPPEWHHPNLIVTEHVAGYTVEGLAATQWMIARRFRELLQQSVGATSEIG